jgi:HD-GYP domain-containing protein (c-di-GMP phosphodiesterase class II)
VTGIKQVKIEVSDLTLGMYVSGLDRPWSQTPFPLQGFYIRERDDMDQLRLYCKFVYIDVQKGRAPAATNLQTINSVGKPVLGTGKERQRAHIHVAPLTIRHNVYREVASLKKETSTASKLHDNVIQNVGSFMDDLSQGRKIEVGKTRELAGQVVESVIRNPDAFAWLARVQEKDEHTYGHVVRSAIWAVMFGRHIGLERKDMNVLAQSTLLKDVGKVKLPVEILAVESRNPKQQEAYQKFIDYSVEILHKTPGITPQVINIIKHHCERYNASGFPSGISGDRIPFLSKVVGIVTVYDAVTNPRESRYPLAPSKAMAKLYEMRDIEFQEELVVQFIQALGIYPTGTLVELSSGEVGVVVEQTFERRLKPKVMVVLGVNKKPLKEFYALDLFEDYAEKLRRIEQIKGSRNFLQAVEIVRDLEPGSFEIDIAAIRDAYLKKTWNWRKLLSE